MIPAIDQQCMNWRNWAIGAGVRWPGPTQVRSWWGKFILDRNMGSNEEFEEITIDAAGAAATHYRIDRLPAVLRKVLVQHYLKGGTKEQKAKACGCSPWVFYDRLHDAHLALQRGVETILSPENISS